MDNTYNISRVSSRPDPVSLAQQAKYKQQGLTVTSNNTSIIPRDSAGNIILQENSETNPLLIIEPVTTKITTNSILRVIETRFQYYSFPASIIPIASESLDFNIELTTAENDPIFARYKPSEDRKINASGVYSGILMDEIESGNLQKNTNTYYITKEIKNSGKDLRFRIKLQHRFDAPNPATGTSYFSIIKQGPNFDIDRSWIELGGDFINQYEIQNLYSDQIILNNQFEIGDNFSIGALAGQNSEFTFHTINSEQTYWAITDASKNVDEWNQEI